MSPAERPKPSVPAAPSWSREAREAPEPWVRLPGAPLAVSERRAPPGEVPAASPRPEAERPEARESEPERPEACSEEAERMEQSDEAPE